jgi:negative regulator of genetic competence, sporulation and motility
MVSFFEKTRKSVQDNIIAIRKECYTVELKLVSENKLKITLTNEDMAALDITFEDMNYEDNTYTRRVLWEILDKAKRQTGFDAASDKILVQVQEKKNDGCLIFVTKVSALKTEQQYPAYAKSYKKVYTGIKKKRLLYVFESSETLHEACRQLMLVGYGGKSDIFVSTEDIIRYYLYIEDNREQCLDMISEYGFLINNPLFSFYLDEHAKKILAADAVQAFAEIFS